MARPRAFDETRVLRAARDQFWATGYAGTSIDTIAAVTGLGKGSLYGAFGDKRALFTRVFEDHCAQITEASTDALAGPDAGALERLERYVRANAVGTAAAISRGCLLAKGTAELAEQDAQIAGAARRALQAIEDALTSTVEAAQRNGDVEQGVDARLQAQLILAVLRGIEALGKAGTSPAVLQDIAETALAAVPRHKRAKRTTRTERARRSSRSH